MKKFALLFVFAGLLVSCKEDAQNLTSEQETIAEAAGIATESATAKEGFGKINLKSGAQMATIEGRCGGVTNTGEMIIAVQDKTVASKVFTISFNTPKYPENGKVYTIKKSDYMSEGKKPENEIYIGFSEVTQKSQMDWSSDDASGTMTFQVNGNEIKCQFDNIKLQPSMVYNKGEWNNVGTASGEITLYKN